MLRMSPSPWEFPREEGVGVSGSPLKTPAQHLEEGRFVNLLTKNMGILQAALNIRRKP